MGCLLVILALLLPRAAMVLIWLFTDAFSAAYDTVIWPVLGFFLMPYTTLAYMGAMLNAGQITIGWLVLLVVAVIVDVGHWGGGYRFRGRRRVA